MRWLEPFRLAIGERFTVTKSLYGPITAVQGGHKTAAALGGVNVQTGLTWYGANFPRDTIESGRSWSDNFPMRIGARFLGLPSKARHTMNVICHYLAEGEQEFQGMECPRVSQQVSMTGKSTWGLMRVESEGRGTGLILPNLVGGKIARSQKNVKLRCNLRPPAVRAPASVIDVSLQTDSWHET